MTFFRSFLKNECRRVCAQYEAENDTLALAVVSAAISVVYVWWMALFRVFFRLLNLRVFLSRFTDMTCILQFPNNDIDGNDAISRYFCYAFP